MALQLMVLPAADAPPQIFMERSGMWRDTLPPPVGSTQSKLRQNIEKNLVNAMNEVAQNPATGIDPASVSFKGTFESLHKSLLSADVVESLRTAAAAAGARPALNIHFRSGAEWIPWELLHDGTGYLGLRFAMSRMPILTEALDAPSVGARQVRKVFNLLAKEVLNGQPFADWEGTFSGFGAGNGWEERFPNGAGVFPSLVQFDFAGDVDVIHVTCHGGFHDPATSEFYWTLDHTSPSTINYNLTPGIAQTVRLKARPLVFGNACASTASFAANSGALQGFGASFLIGGAHNFVGTFAPITKTMAVMFARRFYQRLFAGTPIAEALRATKQSFADEGVRDPSYLFYCLYGPGDTVYQVTP